MSSSFDRPLSAWFVVSQVKTHRVVYFTDDPAYEPPQDGDWYFVSHYLGDLPAGMTLRNCWGWRFSGTVFADAREKQAPTPTENLLSANRRALLALLAEKVQRMHPDGPASSWLDLEARRLKVEEARRFLAMGGGDAVAPQEFRLLQGAADARGLTMADAARLVLDGEAAFYQRLAWGEALRERMTLRVEAATTQGELIELRRILLEETVPQASKHYPYPATPMRPEELEAPMSEVHRAHEIARLNAQLRDRINDARHPARLGYVGEDILMRHKARLARQLIDAGGVKAPDVDFSLLEGFAQARSLGILDAARLIWSTVEDAEKKLWATELHKDRLQARIQAMRTVRDVRQVERELREALQD